jgi:nucleotide-binding universal stress UspA family protein
MEGDAKEAQMNTLLIPLDGSERAEQILPYAQPLALLLKARLYLLRVVPEVKDEELFAVTIAETYQRGDGPSAVQRERAWHSWATQRRHAEGYLESLAMMTQSEQIRVDFEVRLGDPAEEIVAAAEEQHAALIALATHGYSGLKRWALGSVTDKVVHATNTPVFILRSQEQMHVGEIAFKRILVPLDSSNFARQALPLATEIATRSQAEMILLQALTTTFKYPEIDLPEEVQRGLHTQAQQELAAVAGELRAYQLPIATAVVAGPAAEAIVEKAAERNVDLIVMATHGYSGIKRWTLGSVADKVLHAATTPLLLVQAGSVELLHGN